MSDLGRHSQQADIQVRLRQVKLFIADCERVCLKPLWRAFLSSRLGTDTKYKPNSVQRQEHCTQKLFCLGMHHFQNIFFSRLLFYNLTMTYGVALKDESKWNTIIRINSCWAILGIFRMKCSRATTKKTTGHFVMYLLLFLDSLTCHQGGWERKKTTINLLWGRNFSSQYQWCCK